MTDQLDIKQLLLKLGLMFEPFAGIQIDLNVVFKRLPNGSIIQSSKCDHNCTDKVGGYDCNAAFSYAKGTISGFARASKVIEWLLICREGLKQARDEFLANSFEEYCQERAIPGNVAPVIREMMSSDVVEINLFGGNPEMHPEIFFLIAELKRLSFRVNFTTTGRAIMFNEEFRDRLGENPPHLLAVSADDVQSFDQLDEALNMDLPGLKAKWDKVDRTHGQDQKFYEGIATALIASQRADFPPVLFNTVVHPGNLPYIMKMMEGIQVAFPKALVNPYPGQTSFDGKPSPYGRTDLGLFEDLVDYMIDKNLAGDTHYTRRLHYYCVQKASLNKNRNNVQAASNGVAGYGLWHCARKVGAGLYLQVSKSPAQETFQLTKLPRGSKPAYEVTSVPEGIEFTGDPGGHLGCYWNNSSVTELNQISSVGDVMQHLLGGMTELAQRESATCKINVGCSMPRLWFNMITTERGLNPSLWPYYQPLREWSAGF